MPDPTPTSTRWAELLHLGKHREVKTGLVTAQDFFLMRGKV